MRKVILATPTYDRSVGADYHFSVVQTVKLCAQHGIDVCPLLWPGEALVQHARNALAQQALEMNPEDVVWVDADHDWRPEWFLRLLSHNVDVVGAAYPKKADTEQYAVHMTHFEETSDLWRVNGLGTGFLRTTAKALRAIWDTSEPYKAFGGQWRMIFDVQLVDGRLWGEDMIFCAKLTEAGFPVYLDPSFTVNHHGAKKYTGDFAQFVKKVAVPPPSRAPLCGEFVATI